MIPAFCLLVACQLMGDRMTATSNGPGSTVSRANTISVIHVLNQQERPWKDSERMQQRREVQLTLRIGPVLKGAAQPADKVKVTVEQWRDSGPRFTAPRGPWSAVELTNGGYYLVFSKARSGAWADEIIPAATLVCLESICLEQVRAALAMDWDALGQMPANAPAWGPLLAETLVEKTLSFSRQPDRWDRALTLLEREGLPLEFRAKATQELFASIGLIAPLTRAVAQRTMLFGFRMLAVPDGNRGLHKNLISVYLPNLRRSVDGGATAATDLLPLESDRKWALSVAMALPPSSERDRLLEWLSR